VTAIVSLTITGDNFGDWATGVGAAATVGILIAAVWAAVYGVRNQIEQQRAIERRRRVYEHQAKVRRATLVRVGPRVRQDHPARSSRP
jgi:hypothetical protein